MDGKEGDYRPHPAIVAWGKIFSFMIDPQLKRLKEQGMLPQHKIERGKVIFKRPDPRDLERWENQDKEGFMD